ncbi:MAG: adenosylmethionine decarboxylase, partial [Sphingobacteriales bacterium]
ELTLDVYLCNYMQDNTPKVRLVAGDYIHYFDAEILKDVEINR